MNNKIKTISAAVLAVVMCASFAGCSKKDDNGVYVDKNGNVSVNESKFEDHVNSVFGGESNTTSSSTETSQSKERYKMTDEIKSADFDSGLIQIDNEVFQQGGYITVAELVEKCKDNYDITYWADDEQKGTYEECKDFLVEYNLEPSDYADLLGVHSYYSLKLTPKNGENKELRAFEAVLGNLTSPDEKITVDKGIVISYTLSFAGSQKTTHSVWLPEGFGLTGFLNAGANNFLSHPADMEMVNGDYTVKTITELLKQKGFTLSEHLPLDTVGEAANGKVEEFDKKYSYDGTSEIEACCIGKANLFGYRPIYRYKFIFDSNTDKIDEVSLYLLKFVE